MTVTDMNNDIGKFLIEKHPSWSNFTAYNKSIEHLLQDESYKILKKNIIYLSPDSSNILDTINPNDIFIIGAIADRSVENMTLSQAKKLSLKHACLPIKKYIPNGLQKYALNIETVVKILLDINYHNLTWKDALYNNIPLRYINRRHSKPKRYRKTNNYLL